LSRIAVGPGASSVGKDFLLGWDSVVAGWNSLAVCGSGPGLLELLIQEGSSKCRAACSVEGKAKCLVMVEAAAYHVTTRRGRSRHDVEIWQKTKKLNKI